MLFSIFYTVQRNKCAFSLSFLHNIYDIHIRFYDNFWRKKGTAMNLPNKITIIRICFIPLFIIILLSPLPFDEKMLFHLDLPLSHVIAACIFIIAAGTDWLDGYFARKLHLITDFGKFLDPLADKLLVTAALISLVELHLLPGWIAIVIISREFAVTGIRLVAASSGEVIAASSLGKAKTIVQMIAIPVLLLHNWPFALISFPFDTITISIATVLTIVSGIDYFVKNKHIIMKTK